MEFKPSKTVDTSGTSLQGYVCTSFLKLRKNFGMPSDSDGYKVSTEWSFVSNKGEPITLYDYKATNLYNKDYPSVDEFRQQSSFEWHIGAKSVKIAYEFKEWLSNELE